MRSYKYLFTLPVLVLIVTGCLSVNAFARDQHVKQEFTSENNEAPVIVLAEADILDPSGKLTGLNARQGSSIRNGSDSTDGLSTEKAEMLKLIREMDDDIARMEKEKSDTVIKVDKVTGELIREEKSGQASVLLKPGKKKVAPVETTAPVKREVKQPEPARPIKQVESVKTTEPESESKPTTSLKPVKVVRNPKPVKRAEQSNPISEDPSGLATSVAPTVAPKTVIDPMENQTATVKRVTLPRQSEPKESVVTGSSRATTKPARQVEPIKLAEPKNTSQTRESGVSAKLVEPGGGVNRTGFGKRYSVVESATSVISIEPGAMTKSADPDRNSVSARSTGGIESGDSTKAVEIDGKKASVSSVESERREALVDRNEPGKQTKVVKPDSKQAVTTTTIVKSETQTGTTTETISEQAPPSENRDIPASETIEISKADEFDESTLPAAAKWYLEMAKKGDKEAQHNLGSLFETGFGVTANNTQAAKWYLKAAEQGHALAQLKVGMLYLLGLGVRESSLKGSRWVRASAKNGNELSDMLSDKVLTLEVEEGIDTKKIIAEVHTALDKGDIYAQEKLIQLLARLKKQRENAPKKERFAGNVTGSAAKPGTVGNQVPSFLRTDGSGSGFGETDFVEIHRQAKEGDVESQYLLGRMYETGQKVKNDYLQAYTWYSSASVQGHREAQYRLALAYIYGRGVAVNSKKGGIWLNKAAAQKHEAARHLVRYFTSDVDGTINYNNSIVLSWYLEKAIAGDGDAQFAVGYLLENGWGVDAKVTDAREWYSRARAAGTHDAAVQLRRMKAVAPASEPARNAAPVAATAPRAPVKTARTTEKQGDGFELPAIGVPSSSQLKSLMVPIGLLMIGLTMVMAVFRWLDKGVQNNSGSVGDPRDRTAM